MGPSPPAAGQAARQLAPPSDGVESENREAVPSQSPVLPAARRATLGSLRPHTLVNPNGVPHQAISACETPSGFCGDGGCGIPSVAHACRRADTGLCDGTPSGFDVGGGCRLDAHARGSGPTTREIAPGTRDPNNREAVPSQSPVLPAARRATLGSLCPHTFVNPNGVRHQDTSACETPSGCCGGGGCGIPSVAHACRRADTGLWDGTPSGFSWPGIAEVLKLTGPGDDQAHSLS
jgi:hypothetical protein